MLRLRAAMVLPLLIVAGVAAACEVRDVAQDRSAESAAATAAARAAAPPRSRFPDEPPLACATLRDVAVSDVVRVDGTTLLYADGSDGLAIVDVADALRPRQLATIPFVGTPIALFAREGVAWLVFLDADSRFLPGKMATVVRAVDIRLPAQPRIIGEIVREGSARDAKLVGGLLYTMRETGGRTAVESFGVKDTSIHALGIADLRGLPAQLAASSAGLAVVTVDETHSNVAWLDLPMEQRGALLVRETVRVPGGVATWARGEGRVVAADDGQRVRLVTCATRSCSPADAATLRVVAFGAQASARIGPSLRVTERGGLPLTRFADELLYVAETSATTHGSSVLHIMKTEDSGSRVVSHVPLRGLLSALVPRDGSLVALGTVESPESASTIVVHDIDVRRPSTARVRSTVTFGSDWTWSAALDDDDAISFDPGSHLIAVPFTAWRKADKRYVTGTQLVDLGPHGAQSAETVPADGYIERAVFLGGHLVTIGPSGVTGIDYAASRRHDVAERGIDLGPREIAK